jgi:hypothetical protein
MSERPMYYIEVDGVAMPVADSTEWTLRGGKMKVWCVAKTYRGDGEVQVSTVFLGLDHAWHGPPMIYETMVFWLKHDLDNECDRYSMREEARVGHEAMVARVDAEILRMMVAA